MTEEYLKTPIQFWICPDGHSDRQGVVTVKWVDGIAHCTMPDCPRTSAEVSHECPCCGETVTMVPYDIGSGPELACPNCETCFGANGQPLDARDAVRWIGDSAELRKMMGWENEDGTPALLLAFTNCLECGKAVASKWHWETGTQRVEHCARHQ